MYCYTPVLMLLQMTKEEFDSNARSLLSSSVVHLHNEFFLAILTKCQLFTTAAPAPGSESSIHSNSIFGDSNIFSKSNSSNGIGAISTNSYSNNNNNNDDLFDSLSNPTGCINSFNSSNSFFGSNNSNYSTSGVISSSTNNKSSENGNFSSSESTNYSSSSSAANTNAIFNSLLNSSSNPNFTSSNSLGTKTNAFTINNSSGNISIKVEVPMHSLEGINNSSSLGLGNPTVIHEKKKPVKQAKKKQKINKQGYEVRSEGVLASYISILKIEY